MLVTSAADLETWRRRASDALESSVHVVGAGAFGTTSAAVAQSTRGGSSQDVSECTESAVQRMVESQQLGNMAENVEANYGSAFLSTALPQFVDTLQLEVQEVQEGSKP